MIINNNSRANFIALQSEKSLGGLRKATEKLASGLRINSAADDASGLAVSERMRTQIRGLRQAEQNAQNGLSFTQVADGALSQVNEILQRVRELSVQAANGIYSIQDRQAIQMEVSQLVDEVDRISSQAQFNRQKLFAGNFAKGGDDPLYFHVGADMNQRIRAYIGTMSTRSLGLVDNQNRRITLSTPTNANTSLGTVDTAIDQLNMERAGLGSQGNRLEITLGSILDTYTNLMAAESRIRDADMAREYIEYTRNSMLLQSNMALLGQANLEPKLVTELLRP